MMGLWMSWWWLWTLFALGSVTSKVTTVRSPVVEPRLLTLSRSEACPVVLDQDPPRYQRSLRHVESLVNNNLKRSERIFNGDEASPNLLPYIAAIFRFNEELDSWSPECSGTLVSSRWVISGAYCNISTADKVLLLGRNTADFDGTDSKIAVVSDIANVSPHLKYARTETDMRYDIAAIELKTDAPANAKFMKVNVNPSFPEPNSFSRVAGFGTTEAVINIPVLNRDLLQVDVPITTFEECSEAYGSVSDISIDRDAHICAGYIGKGRCDSCFGDNGGPMIQYNEAGEPVLVGVISVGTGCGLSDFPGVYVRTATYEAWMDNETRVKYTKTRTVKSQFKNNLSSGAIAGISVAAVTVLILAILIALVIVRRGRSKRTSKLELPSENPIPMTLPSRLDADDNGWGPSSPPMWPHESGPQAIPSFGSVAQGHMPHLFSQQSQGSPQMAYAPMTPSNANIAHQVQNPGPGYGHDVVAIDYSKAGLRNSHVEEYAYRGESGELAPPQSSAEGDNQQGLEGIKKSR